MKRLLAALVCAMVLLGPSGVRAGGLYLRGEAGWSIAAPANLRDKEMDPNKPTFINSDNGLGEFDEIGHSPLLAVGVGTRVLDKLRVDLTAGYRGGFRLDGTGPSSIASTTSADIVSLALMANACWDFPPTGPVRPYLGVGLGWAHNTISNILERRASVPRYDLPDGSTNNLAWQLSAGVGWKLANNFTLDLGYRYLDAGKIESDAGNVVRRTNGTTLPTAGVKGRLAAHEPVVDLRFDPPPTSWSSGTVPMS